MAKKGLTKADFHLWQLYTKDIKRMSRDVGVPIFEKINKNFEIKIPTENTFKNTYQPNVTNFESLKNNDNNWGKKLRQGKFKPEGKIDLHGMTCVEAHEKLYRYLDRAQRNGKRVVLVVTGKGGPKTGYAEYRFMDFENTRGVLKREVPLWLSGGAMRHMIVSFQDAGQSHGGSGALYVVLKRLS